MDPPRRFHQRLRRRLRRRRAPAVDRIIEESTRHHQSRIRVTFVDSVLFPVGYEFANHHHHNDNDNDNETGSPTTTAVLSEISACRFLPPNDHPQSSDTNPSSSSSSPLLLRYTVLLVGDGGEVFTAHVELQFPNTAHNNDDPSSNSNNNTLPTMKIKLTKRVPLELSSFHSSSVDSEGMALLPQSAVLSERRTNYSDNHPPSSPPEPQQPLLLVGVEEPVPPVLDWFRIRTGQQQLQVTPHGDTDNNNKSISQPLPSFNLPEEIVARIQPNLGFEAVAAVPPMQQQQQQQQRPRNCSSSLVEQPWLVVGTTEAALRDDPPHLHRWFVWNAAVGGQPVDQFLVQSSDWKPTAKLFISGTAYWPETQSLLVLERGFDGETNMVRLWSLPSPSSDTIETSSECDVLATTNEPKDNNNSTNEEEEGEISPPEVNKAANNDNQNRTKLSSSNNNTTFLSYGQSLLNWTGDELVLVDDTSSTTHSLPVDNYEAVCFLPPLPPTFSDDQSTNSSHGGGGGGSTTTSSRYLLLVNDDNRNPDQIGTQFVLLRLDVLEDDGNHRGPAAAKDEPSSLFYPTPRTTNVPLQIVGLALFLGALFLLYKWVQCSRGRHLPSAVVAAAVAGETPSGYERTKNVDHDDDDNDGDEQGQDGVGDAQGEVIVTGVTKNHVAAQQEPASVGGRGGGDLELT